MARTTSYASRPQIYSYFSISQIYFYYICIMVSINPDKHIRKAIFDKINNIVVSSKTIPCYDSRAHNAPDNYILLTAQSKDIDKSTKCGYEWESSILIEIYTAVSSSGNNGSRLLLNEIEENVMNLLNPNLIVDNFANQMQNITFENSLETITDTQIIMRSFVRLNINLKQI